jgi:hypothetical protein
VDKADTDEMLAAGWCFQLLCAQTLVHFFTLFPMLDFGHPSLAEIPASRQEWRIMGEEKH